MAASYSHHDYTTLDSGALFASNRKVAKPGIEATSYMCFLEVL